MASKYKKRADGRYLVQVQKGIKPDGKPDYKNIYGRTIAELEKKEREFRQELEKGIIVDDEGLTVAAWANKWLETYKSHLQRNTIEMYRIMVDAHIIPALGLYRLKELKTHHIQDLINQQVSKGHRRTAENILLTIKQILGQAVKNEYIFKNVALNVEAPKKEKPQKRALSEKEKGYIEKANLTLKQKAFVYMLLYTGVRRGEILSLTQSDIDLKNKTVTINKAVVFNKNNAEIKNSPKSEAGRRSIPIPNDLVVILKEYVRTLETFTFFPSARGELMTLIAFRRFWENIIDAINAAAGGRKEGKDKDGKKTPKVLAIANDITPHIFRHTYATMLFYAGVDMKTAQYLLGHSSIQMTMDVYTHLNAEDNQNAGEKLNAYLSKTIEDTENI